jgi:hypothetical protein
MKHHFKNKVGVVDFANAQGIVMFSKNQVVKINFDELDFQPGYTGSKNPVQNRPRIQFIELDFSKLIFQKSSTDQQGESYIAHVICYYDPPI